MTKSNRILLISGLAFGLVSVLAWFFNRRLGVGLLCGYATGLVNYLLISFSVKRVLSLSGAISGKVTLSGIFYFSRFLLAIAIIGAVLTAVKHCSFAGFLTGFSAFLVTIIVSKMKWGTGLKPLKPLQQVSR